MITCFTEICRRLYLNLKEAQKTSIDDDFFITFDQLNELKSDKKLAERNWIRTVFGWNILAIHNYCLAVECKWWLVLLTLISFQNFISKFWSNFHDLISKYKVAKRTELNFSKQPNCELNRNFVCCNGGLKEANEVYGIHRDEAKLDVWIRFAMDLLINWFVIMNRCPNSQVYIKIPCRLHMFYIGISMKNQR